MDKFKRYMVFGHSAHGDHLYSGGLFDVCNSSDDLKVAEFWLLQARIRHASAYIFDRVEGVVIKSKDE